MQPTVEVVREFAYPVGDVFAAWIAPHTFAKWFLPDPAVIIRRAEMDPREGGAFLIEMDVGGEILLHTGTFHRMVTNEHLAFTWQSAMAGPTASFVEVRFEGRGRGTLVTLRHSRLPSAEMCDAHARGWANILLTLDNFLKLGEKP